MNRAFTNVLSDDVDATAQFYEDILGMVRHADFGWFVILTHPGIPGLEFGILDRTHETVPGGVRPIAGGTIVTFVVDDLENALRAARRVDAEIIDGPTDMPYEQRRLLLKDPAGTAVDISAPIPR